ncbi:cardiolipin synthase [Streptoalloteichus hindustanus]|uniref:Cardiolipin synthase n=1 Tax=Streptoalloteichus hindustanus TaxID=2017 RepID=A0A1M5LUJ4_STRHI|nr:cardiolipin synthase [Streptoalloteichus hindustanus]
MVQGSAQRPDQAGRGETPRGVVADVAQDRVLTVPNLLSFLRLAGVPLFLWLLLGPKADLLALVVLVVSGLTDWLDGKLARLLNQYSRLGALLDPAVDRLYTLATLFAFLVREILPWWVVAALVLRDVAVSVSLLLVRRAGYAPPEVNYIGKAATFNLMYGFPLLLLAQGDSTAAEIARPFAYAFVAWGGALFLWSGLLYVVQVVMGLRADRIGTAGAASA